MEEIELAEHKIVDGEGNKVPIYTDTDSAYTGPCPCCGATATCYRLYVKDVYVGDYSPHGQ